MIATRRLFLGLPFLLAACADQNPPPASYPKLDFAYLGQLQLDVAEIRITDTWAPRGAAKHVEYLAPESPDEALQAMARERLVAAGSKGVAEVMIEDASIVRTAQGYTGTLAVRVTVTGADGAERASARASIEQVRPGLDDTPEATRDTLYTFVKSLMRDMNVEFEYQVRRSLKSVLVSADANPAPVQSEDLTAPAKQKP